jgi:hypothetical protein
VLTGNACVEYRSEERKCEYRSGVKFSKFGSFESFESRIESW